MKRGAKIWLRGPEKLISTISSSQIDSGCYPRQAGYEIRIPEHNIKLNKIVEIFYDIFQLKISINEQVQI